MGLDFPNTPIVGQLFPNPALAGIPVWQWDGSEWGPQGSYSNINVLGFSAGTSTANGVGVLSGTTYATGSAFGAGNLQGVGISSGLASAIGTSAGTGNITGVGISSYFASSVGSSGGVGTASALTPWQNISVTAQTASFQFDADTVPSASAMDNPVGLSNGLAGSMTNLACIVRFSNTGNIDIRNGGAYGSDATVSYTGGTSYHIRILGYLSTHTYDVYITPFGGTATKIATGYAFRTEQNTVTTINNFAIAPAQTDGAAGIVNASNITMVTLTNPPVVTNASFNLTIPATAGTVVGQATATNSPTSWSITGIT
jgi:hypothetical protein